MLAVPVELVVYDPLRSRKHCAFGGILSEVSLVSGGRNLDTCLSSSFDKVGGLRECRSACNVLWRVLVGLDERALALG
jgi:hypothetical protein